MSRVVASWHTNLSPQATSAQQIDYDLMVVIQHTTRLRVGARPQEVENLVAKNANPCRRPPPQRGGSTEDTPNKREVGTIFGGSHDDGNSKHTRDKYTREAKTPSHVVVQTTNSSFSMGTTRSEDIIFIETDASWVHHPHEDALVIITKIANNLIYQVLIDSGSVVNILHWNAY